MFFSVHLLKYDSPPFFESYDNLKEVGLFEGEVPVTQITVIVRLLYRFERAFSFVFCSRNGLHG